MCRKTSKRQSGRPASSTRTRVPGSSDRRFASTQPAEPPPTITTSKRSSIGSRSYRLRPPAGSVNGCVARGRGDQAGSPLSGTGVGVVEAERRGERAALPVLLPQPNDVVADRGVGRIAEVLDAVADHPG